MKVVYPFSLMDDALALKNAEWMNELGGCPGHECLIIHDKRCSEELVSSIFLELTKAFDKVEIIKAQTEIDGWPEGANYFFRVVAAILQDKCPYFMWMEPDAIPMVPGWLDKLEAEYKRAGRPFMGDRVQVEDIPLHMSGVGIYPNPLHAFSGDAYRAVNIAWDMAGKDQIVPKAHFTKLIEHAWRHKTFTNPHELKTQMAPETILFHSSKDGSLINLLRARKAAPETDAHSVPTEPTSGSPSREEIGTRAAQPPIYDIFIRTYPGDYQWLDYCVFSIHKFCTGFRKIWVISPAPQISSVKGVEWKVMNDECPDGYLAQQITKLYADVITSYQADYILHVDSDTLFTRPVTPEMFFEDGKPTWYYTPYESIQTPWKPVTEKFIRDPVAYEFMRRMPFLIPKWLYAKMREYCHKTHGVIISDYIRMQPPREFSEFNAIGAYAFRNHTASFKWINTLDSMPEHFCRQFRSYDGLTPENKSEIDSILSGAALGASVTRIGAGEEEIEALARLSPTEPAPPPIKKLPSGVWVLENDQISAWVEQEGRLDHDQNLLPNILKHIRPGDTVIDVGAFIGDHTIAYFNAVGEMGMVHAFEPNKIAFDCLVHNVSDGVICYRNALGDTIAIVPISGNNGNAGGSYIGEHMKTCDAKMVPLDKFKISPDFIKIDVEGCELKVLRGAENTINKYRPKMVIEMNIEALRRQGHTPDEIYSWLDKHDYKVSIMQENCSMASPLYDILCLPETKPPENSSDSLAHHSESSPVAFPTVKTVKEEVEWCVGRLRGFCEESLQYKAMVMLKLVHAGLRPVKPKKGKPNGSKAFKWRRQRAIKKPKPQWPVELQSETTPT